MGLLGDGVYWCWVMRGVGRFKRYSVSLASITYRYVLLAGLKFLFYY